MKGQVKRRSGWQMNGWLLAAIVACGIVLRLIWVQDMEYKLDEMWMFKHVSAFLKGEETFPWLGMPSGAQVKNPGMSVWIFILLGKVFGTESATSLCMGVMVLNCVALGFFAWFACKEVEPSEREAWGWGIANLAVNPLAVLLHRKIWAQSVLPIFCFLFLWLWWRRHRPWRAFGWGLVGALLGQIHMSGFFMAAGFVIWSAIFEKFKDSNCKTHWRGWFAGSCMGALPLIPWLRYFLTQGKGEVHPYEYWLITEFRFWVFWASEPLGFHLGNLLGVKQGEGFFTQNASFFRTPLIGATPTYIVGFLHAVKALCGLVVAWIAVHFGWKNRLHWKSMLVGTVSQTAFTMQAALLAFGNLVNFSGTVVRRYYVVIATPLPEVWFSRLALLNPKLGRYVLHLLIWAQLAISAALLVYLHEHHGAPQGDYGRSYETRGPEFQ